MKVLRLLRTCLTAGAGVVVTLAQLDLPKNFWDKQILLQWVSVAVVAIFVIHEAVAEINYLNIAARGSVSSAVDRLVCDERADSMAEVESLWTSTR